MTEVEMKAADNRAAAKKAQVDAAAKDMKMQRDEQQKLNAEVMAAQDKCRPTPTPDELTSAMAGENVMEKQPDGSPEQNIHSVAIDPKKARADQSKMNEEVMAATAKTRPTPTIDEVTRAAAGERVMDKEHDGTAPVKKLDPKAGEPGYTTREATAVSKKEDAKK